jgi:hypothetical protein
MRTRLTIAQYADLQGVKRDTIYKRIKNNTLSKVDKSAKLEVIAGINFISVKGWKSKKLRPFIRKPRRKERRLKLRNPIIRIQRIMWKFIEGKGDEYTR